MKAFRVFSGEHNDYIHDATYDYTGRRLATCSSDSSIKVWDMTENGNWVCTATIPNAHNGTIYKLSWAHPEFGQVLASCSSDRFVHIYEEAYDPERGTSTWKRKPQLTDATGPVTCVQFAPRHMGPRLATCGLDGWVRIYSTNDVLNLTSWTADEVFEAAPRDCYSLAWNVSPFDPAMIVVAAKETVRVWEMNEKYRRWTPLIDLPGHKGDVRSVAWAHPMGRSYHLIATACRDGNVRIFKLWSRGKAGDIPKPQVNRRNGESNGTNTSSSSSDYNDSGAIVEMVAELSDHNSEVWSVSWNATGTVLASSGDDGTARLWRSDMLGTWRCTMVTSASASMGEVDASVNATQSTVSIPSSSPSSSSSSSSLTTSTSSTSSPPSSQLPSSSSTSFIPSSFTSSLPSTTTPSTIPSFGIPSSLPSTTTTTTTTPSLPSATTSSSLASAFKPPSLGPSPFGFPSSSSTAPSSATQTSFLPTTTSTRSVFSGSTPSATSSSTPATTSASSSITFPSSSNPLAPTSTAAPSVPFGSALTSASAFSAPLSASTQSTMSAPNPFGAPTTTSSTTNPNPSTIPTASSTTTPATTTPGFPAPSSFAFVPTPATMPSTFGSTNPSSSFSTSFATPNPFASTPSSSATSTGPISSTINPFAPANASASTTFSAPKNNPFAPTSQSGSAPSSTSATSSTANIPNPFGIPPFR